MRFALRLVIAASLLSITAPSAYAEDLERAVDDLSRQELFSRVIAAELIDRARSSTYGIDAAAGKAGLIGRKVAGNKRIRFAYTKVTERSKDARFDYDWEQAKLAGLRRGVVHVFSFCRSAKAQFEIIKRHVPRTDDALPFALNILWYGKPMAYEKECVDLVAFSAGNISEASWPVHAGRVLAVFR